MELIKFLKFIYLVLMIKDIYIYIYILDDGINSLAYFHEGIFKNKSD